MRRPIRLAVLIPAIAALLGLPSAVLADAPPTLTGEVLNHGWSPSNGTGAPMLEIDCDPADVSTITFGVSGDVAFGPYPGTFTETATFTFGPQVTSQPNLPSPVNGSLFDYARGELTGALLSGSAEFTIASPTGQVTGTKTYTGASDSFGICRGYENAPLPGGLGGGTGNGHLWMVYGTLDYVAEIHTPEGDWQDMGTSLLWFAQNQVTRVPDGGSTESGAFQQGFVSDGTLEPGATPTMVTLTPQTAVNNVGTQHTVTATVENAGGMPVGGVDVDFTVAGSINTTLSCPTGASGECSVTYNGPSLPGADLIVGCADSDGNGARDPGEPCGEATKAWLLPSSTPGQVTGGGHVLNPSDGEEVAFGFNAKSDSKGLKGNCTVVDKAPARNVKIKCLTVDSLVQSGNSATFFGQADVNGVTTTYRIDVTDNGEPGRNRDTFTIQTGTGYSAGGLLDNGNIQVHN